MTDFRRVFRRAFVTAAVVTVLAAGECAYFAHQPAVIDFNTTPQETGGTP